MSRVHVLLLLPAVLCACGGSSSETPFPVEPDLERLEGKPATRYIVVSEGRAAESKPEDEPPPEESAPPVPAPATWGAPSEQPAAPALPEVPLQ